MRCDTPPATTPCLPPGYCFCAYEKGMERDWAALEYAIGDFASEEDALHCFLQTYGLDLSALEQRCRFIQEEASGRVVSTCTAWYDTRGGSPVSSLHWLVTHPACQGLGLGRAMLHHTMNIYAALNGYPVYLHTQPWSYRAVWLYHKSGFHLCKSDTFAQYPNDYLQAMDILQGLLSPVQLHALRQQAE